MADQGFNNDEKSFRLFKSCKWRKRFYEEGLQGLQDLPRGGRQALFPPVLIVESLAELRHEAINRGIVAQEGGTNL